MNNISIGGRKISVPDGCSISIINNTVYVDGKPWEEGKPTATDSILKIEISGTVGEVKAERGSIHVVGNVSGSVTASDGVVCGDVGGDVSAGDGVKCGNVGMNIHAGDGVVCGDVGGNVSAGDDVRCGKVTGSVHAGGDITGIR